MQFYQRELSRLKSAEAFIKKRFPGFGINKRQEITRLIYEVAKRENILPADILSGEDFSDFDIVKEGLLKRRFPYSSSTQKNIIPYLSKIELNSIEAANTSPKSFYPKEVFVERAAAGSYLERRFKNIFPKAVFRRIESLKAYRFLHRGIDVREYNRRHDKVFIVKENHDFFKKCPCTKGAVGCGYHIFNLGFGCPFECTYCYLQVYTNSPGIILPANIDKFFDEFTRSYGRIRIGTGEFSDSLALDGLTEYSLALFDFFKRNEKTTFEFKTKSIEINNLLKRSALGNIVVSWSLNPQIIIDENEFLTPSLKERLNAAAQVAAAGHKVGFHFDPVIYFNGWQEGYRNLVEDLFCTVKLKDIAWISIGTLRFRPDLKQVIERRFAANKILDEELLLGYDNKLRYPYALRYGMYKEMIQMLSSHSCRQKLYLCMEETRMWRDLGLRRIR